MIPLKFKNLEIAIISLARTPERRQRVKFYPNSWVNAYDGKNLCTQYLQDELIKYTNNKFYVPYNHPITEKWRAKMGCFLSHRKALSQFTQPLLILEDDFFPLGDDDLRSYVLHDIPKDWDILLLGGFTKNKKNKAFFVKDGWNKLDTKKQIFYCTHSYIVRDPQKILEMMKGTTPRAYDSYLNFHIYNKTNTYYLYPPLFTQDQKFESTIDSENKYSWLTI